MRKLKAFILFTILLSGFAAKAQVQGDPKLTEQWEPEPEIVTPGKENHLPPSDAIILLSETVNAFQAKNGSPAKWKYENGILTVTPGTGNVVSKEAFGDCQLHIEFRTPSVVKGEGQGRGNSGIFLMQQYEIQVLDSYNNRTYSNGQAGSVYKQSAPMVNASRKPGEWQSYDIIFTAPRFNEKGRISSPARVTVNHNGVVIQNNTVIWGATKFIGLPEYTAHPDKLPLELQDHGDLVSFRNIWIRPL